MDRVKNITKIIINVLCVILFVILAIVIYAKLAVTLNSDIHANYFGYRIFEVASGSMEPTLQINDILLVKVNEKDIKNNDIIAYKEKDKDTVITHRIIDINNETIMVKGDANNTMDSPITKEQVIGKVVKVYPKLGVWKKVFADPKNLILMFITLLLFDAALSYENKDKKNKDEKIKEKYNKEIKQEEKLEINKVETQENRVKKDILETARELALSQMEEMVNEQTQSNIEDEEKVDYTIRLDLNEIQKNIEKSVK